MLPQTGIKIARQVESRLPDLGRVATSTFSRGGASMPTASKLDKLSSSPKGSQPAPEKSEASEAQLLSTALPSDSSPLRAIASQRVLSKLFLSGAEPSESSVETTPARKSEPETGRTIRSSHPTRMESVVQGALTKPLAESEPAKRHISQVLSHVDHDHNVMDLASASYSHQPMFHPLSSPHARAMSTIAEKSDRLEPHKVEDPAVIKAHLDKFRRDGVACFIPSSKHAKFCKTHLGHAGDNAQFVTNKKQLDDVLKFIGREGGTQAEIESRLEELLGIDKGTWNDLLVAVYKEKDPDKIGLRFVSGREDLANPQYGAGGVTRGGMDGGMDEALVDRVPVDQIEFVPLMKYIGILLAKDTKPASEPKTSVPVKSDPIPAPETGTSIPTSSMSVQYPTVLP